MDNQYVQPYIALASHGEAINCFIITKTGLGFFYPESEGFITCTNCYYKGDILSVGFSYIAPNFPFVVRMVDNSVRVNNSYYSMEDLENLSIKMLGQIDMDFLINYIETTPGEVKSNNEMKMIETYYGWNIAKKTERTNELWGIDNGEGEVISPYYTVLIKHHPQMEDANFGPHLIIKAFVTQDNFQVDPEYFKVLPNGDREFYFSRHAIHSAGGSNWPYPETVQVFISAEMFIMRDVVGTPAWYDYEQTFCPGIPNVMSIGYAHYGTYTLSNTKLQLSLGEKMCI